MERWFLFSGIAAGFQDFFWFLRNSLHFWWPKFPKMGIQEFHSVSTMEVYSNELGYREKMYIENWNCEYTCLFIVVCVCSLSSILNYSSLPMNSNYVLVCAVRPFGCKEEEQALLSHILPKGRFELSHFLKTSFTRIKKYIEDFTDCVVSSRAGRYRERNFKGLKKRIRHISTHHGTSDSFLVIIACFSFLQSLG